MIINKSNIDIKYFKDVPIIGSNIKTNSRHEHLKFLAPMATKEGEILEFGVHTGGTLLTICDCFKYQTVYGFDSFEGLPEIWEVSTRERKTNKYKHPKGHFSLKGKLDFKIRENAVLVKGFFDSSLPKWIEDTNIESIKLLHIDSDLYSSAKTILTLLNEYIKPGTIIVFDELCSWWDFSSYDLWGEGEWRALVEWVTEYNRELEVLSRTQHWQSAIRIIK